MRASRSSLLLFAVCGAASACGSDAEVSKPTAPTQNDASFSVSGLRNWYLIGDALTDGHDVAAVTVSAPAGTGEVNVWLGDTRLRLAATAAGFAGNIEFAKIEAGTHQLLFAADGAAEAFAAHSFHRSHPLYVMVSTDWDDADNSDIALTLQQELHDDHPELLLTHFVGPYTFTDPSVSDERRAELVAWTTDMRDTYGDEIGLHIHPYCNFVGTTDVPCRSEPSLVYSAGDPTGYTVLCAAYTEEEFLTLLHAADDLFVANGFGKATSFRAGGWSADLGTLRALAAADYLVDSSANNWSRMEEWDGVRNGVLYEWNKQNWATIDDTSQPYYPSAEDLLSAGTPYVNILELPDIGSMVDYVAGSEMIDIFAKNWNGAPLPQPVAYSIGYHPSNFGRFYKEQLGEALDHVDRYLASADAGPVVYGRVSDMALVWPAPTTAP